jgi:hypothetical protein
MSGMMRGTRRFQDTIPAKAGTHASTVPTSDGWAPTYVGVVPKMGVVR